MGPELTDYSDCVCEVPRVSCGKDEQWYSGTQQKHLSVPPRMVKMWLPSGLLPERADWECVRFTQRKLGGKD